MDETERITLGQFDSAEAALAAARRVVDRDLLEAYKPGMTADELYQHYTSFGSDPFIRSDDRSCEFSAWNYASKPLLRDMHFTGVTSVAGTGNIATVADFLLVRYN